MLLVEDDPTVRTVVDDYLTAHGYEVRAVSDGVRAVAELEERVPDVVVLDRMLPGLTGDEVLRRARELSGVPVLLLTALDSVGARIDGLERGADDYVTKPFVLRELHLRVAALVRRSADARAPLSPFHVGPFRVDPSLRRVSRHGEEIVLTAREYELFVHLVKHADGVVTREDVLREVWGWSFGEPSTVTVHVRRLREKIEPDPAEPRYLRTVWGSGYRFTPDGREP